MRALPSVGIMEAGEHPHGGRFAGTIRSEEADASPRATLNDTLSTAVKRAEALGQAVDFDQRGLALIRLAWIRPRRVLRLVVGRGDSVSGRDARLGWPWRVTLFHAMARS